MASIKAYSWNVNGLRAAYRNGFLDWFASVSPDIVCVQETKAHPEQLPTELVQVPGYDAYFASATTRKGYSGVALYTKQPPMDVRYGFGIPEFDDEGRTIAADFGHFVLLDIYFPNGRSSEERLRYKMRFYDAFLEFVTSLKASGKNIVLCGDVNTAHREVDIARPKENSKTSGFLPEERAWMDRFVGHGFVDTFRMFNTEPGNYTWWDLISRARDRNVGWRIDYFFVNEAFRGHVKNAFILPNVMGSDHCPIGVELELPARDQHVG